MNKYRLVLSIAAVMALVVVAIYFLVFTYFTPTKSGLSAWDLKTETATPVLKNHLAGSPAKALDELSFAFAGDAMFGRNVGYDFQKNNFIDLFANFDASVLAGADIAWLNLEGPISDKEVKQFPEEHSLVFNFSKQAIEALKYLKISVAGLANNHTDNQGVAGLNKTKELLAHAGIDANGDPNKIDGESVKYYKQGNTTVALIAVNALYGAEAGTEVLIKQEKSNNNFVIVLPHWGNEYELTHSARQETLARLWIAAGADLIIGGHPHVVQDAQIIGGKLVIYSLGNFIFDQMFSAETQQGLILSGRISAEKIKITLVPIISKRMKPEIMRGADKEKIIDRVCRPLGDYCKGDEIEI